MVSLFGFKGINEMLGVGFGEALGTEIVHTQDKGGAFNAMAPEARSEWHRFASMWRQLLEELVESQDTCLVEAAEAATNFFLNAAIVGDVDVAV
jgi:hypothetical protein